MNRQNDNTNTPYLSVVIPAYNEEARLPGTLDKIISYLDNLGCSYEILIVNDGSSDGTSELCRRFISNQENARALHHNRNLGKGAAVRTGVMDAQGRYILVCDADLSTPIDEYEGFQRRLNEDADIVIASRGLGESTIVKHQPIYREMAGKTFNLFVRMVAVRGIHDTQCGFKLFVREVAHDIFSRCSISGFGFDMEVLHVAQRLGYRIVELPVHWHHVPGSKVRLFRDGLSMVADLAYIRLRHCRLHRANNIHVAQ